MERRNPTKEEEKIGLYLASFIFLIVFVSAVIGATNRPKEGAVAEAFVAPVDEAVAIVPEEPAAVTPPPPAEFTKPSSAYVKTYLSNTIETCDMAEWGVSFKCDEKWVLQREAQSGPPEVVIYSDPRVTMSWKKFDENVRFLGQLNDLFFEKTNLYRDGFRTEPVKFGGRDAVLVKGLASDDPQVQRRDYFYLSGGKLVSISFAVSPEEKWDEGKLVIQEVKNTFSPLAEQ